jgi:hypothetical protein
LALHQVGSKANHELLAKRPFHFRYRSRLLPAFAGYGNVVRVGGDVRLKRQLSYSSRQGQGSVMPQISELGGGGNPEVGVPAGAGYAMDGGSSGWDDASPTPDQSHHLSGSKRSRDPAHAPPVPDGHHLAPQLSLPSGGGGNGKTIEKLLQFQDAVPCKIRAKRGCATHPRSIAERVLYSLPCPAHAIMSLSVNLTTLLLIIRAGEEDADQRADTEAAGAGAQHGKGNNRTKLHCLEWNGMLRVLGY